MPQVIARRARSQAPRRAPSNVHGHSAGNHLRASPVSIVALTAVRRYSSSMPAANPRAKAWILLKDFFDPPPRLRNRVAPASRVVVGLQLPFEQMQQYDRALLNAIVDRARCLGQPDGATRRVKP
jgi:hypothetical protein